MPKFTNRDINKKRKETLLSTYDRTLFKKSVFCQKKYEKLHFCNCAFMGQNLDFWHENTPKKLIIRVTYFLQIRVD